MKQSAIESKLTTIVRPVVEDMGFRLVLLDYKGGLLQILAEDPATGKLGIDDCEKISRAVSPALEVEDPISGAYRLEISSPGIDRPLIDAGDYRRYTGFEAKIELESPNEEGRKRFRGFIRDEQDGTVTLETDLGNVFIPLHAIQKARLVLSDDLIKATKNGI